MDALGPRMLMPRQLRTGAGKTTIGKLLAGLYEPDAGRITVDGTDLRGLDPLVWRRRLAVRYQDFLRYGLTVRDDVAQGRPAPVDDAVPHAAAGGRARPA